VEEVCAPQLQVPEGFQGHADHLRRPEPGHPAPGQAHLTLQARGLDEFVQGGLEPRREVLDVPVLDQIAAPLGDRFSFQPSSSSAVYLEWFRSTGWWWTPHYADLGIMPTWSGLCMGGAGQ
jgi:hypothetical protein